MYMYISKEGKSVFSVYGGTEGERGGETYRHL